MAYYQASIIARFLVVLELPIGGKLGCWGNFGVK
jgi:hypothetical protein